MPEFISLNEMGDERVREILAKYSIGLTVEEARGVEKILKRAPSVTELVAFSAQGSEHCSYKSSRKYLKLLPTEAPNVILGPGEDAGIVAVASDNGDRWGIVIGHESHNHPSQVVPYEGAATGVGGIVRDIVCMGARVIGVADPLRFGAWGEHKTQWVFDGVTAGIGGYGNPIGVPVLAGDAYFNDSFNQNCLVNVAALGVVKESEIIHSRAPAEAGRVGYDIIMVGKATDNSGFGGASFASFALDEEDRESNKGAVQEPNAFLERHLMVASYDVFRVLQERGYLDKVGFKDIGGGGLVTATVEIVAALGLGAKINLDDVAVSMEHLPPAVILCAETQERFVWIAHPEVTPLILKQYNEIWALPEIMTHARAQVIGKVQEGNYQVYAGSMLEVDVPARDLTHGFKYDRPVEAIQTVFREPAFDHIPDVQESFLAVLGHPNVASRKLIYEQYDKQVQGQVVIEAGEADAGVMRPFEYEDVSEAVRQVGIALSVDGNPRYGRINPYWQGVNAVCEAMRNVAAVGAVPWALTDCLNYGSPEDPQAMWQFVEGVRGVAEAARYIYLKGYDESPVPVVSGNVSFYNEAVVSKWEKRAIDPSAIVSCLGRIEDAAHAITHQFKQEGNTVILIGQRQDELGGSVYYELFSELGANVPKPDFDTVKREIYAVTDCIEQGLVCACHDISDGGLAVALAEMCFGGRGERRMGVRIDLDALGSELRPDQLLFSETGGFVMEVEEDKEPYVAGVLNQHGVWWKKIGETREDGEFVVMKGHEEIMQLKVEEMAGKWAGGGLSQQS